ncbi:unnamed protein product [Lampetra planeri]
MRNPPIVSSEDEDSETGPQLQTPWARERQLRISAGGALILRSREQGMDGDGEWAAELPLAAVVPAAETTRFPAAILPTEGMAWLVGAIGSGTRDNAKETPHPAALQEPACRPRRLPLVPEFVAAGGE